MKTTSYDASDGPDWLGFTCPFPQPVSHAAVPRGSTGVAIGAFLNPKGDAGETEQTKLTLWHDDTALHVRARCETASMDRVRALAARQAPYARDAWGDDALELQIDAGRTQGRYRHIILPPNGIALTCEGFNNRQVHGWHPELTYDVRLEDEAWVVEIELPFAVFGDAPAEGETWGFNAMRVNPSEPSGYVQWAPTFGDALRPELFGLITFGGPPVDRAPEVEAYAQREAARREFFFGTINDIREDAALEALGLPNWDAWGEYLAARTTPLPLRWDGILPGRDGIRERERKLAMEQADALVEQIADWSSSPDLPDSTAISIEPAEALGDAYLLTGERKYVDAFETALAVHSRRLKEVLAKITDTCGGGLHYAANPYHDRQIVRAEMLAYTYLNMRRAGLSPETHATMMWIVLRGGRFAAFNVATAYTYGNHQIYESAGLAAVAALFPEFPESDAWASVASRSIRLHLERELYPDGGHMERCGYHGVAMTFTMQAIATIRANHVETRFPELMSPETQGRLGKMHEWMLLMTSPDGRMPAFGDVGASFNLRFLERGAALFATPELAWPLSLLAPDMVPPGLTPRQPSQTSVALDSHFTVLRDGWSPDAFFMAVDHGPLGGQHSHIDTLSFVAYAHGRPVAVDTGIGTSYADPRYTTWFRNLRAHNVIAIDDLQPEKVAERTLWQPGNDRDVLGMHSGAYEAALGVRHARTITFVKGTGWFILDELAAPEGVDLGAHNIDWILHTPYELMDEGHGILHAGVESGGLLVLAGRPETLAPPEFEKTPASMTPNGAATMRQWDSARRYGEASLREITHLSWRKRTPSGNHCQFAVFLLPYRAGRPEARLEPTPTAWTLFVNGEALALG